jgi:hypothetical protein
MHFHGLKNHTKQEVTHFSAELAPNILERLVFDATLGVVNPVVPEWRLRARDGGSQGVAPVAPQAASLDQRWRHGNRLHSPSGTAKTHDRQKAIRGHGLTLLCREGVQQPLDPYGPASGRRVRRVGWELL